MMLKKGLFTVRFAAVFTALMLVAGGTAFAQKTITLAAYTFPPYSSGNTPETVSGADTEITLAVLKRMGYKAEFTVRPFPRALKEMKAGRLAGILPCVDSPARREFIYFSSIPTAALDRRFYKLKSRDIKWNTLEDLKGMKIGAGDYSYGGGFWEAGKSGLFKIDVVKNKAPDLTNFKKLVAGRIDLLIVDLSVGGNIIAEHAPQFNNVDVAPYQSVGKVVPFSFGLSKKYWEGREAEAKAFLKEYEATLLKFIEEGGRNRVFAKYNMKPDIDSNNRLKFN